VRDASLLLRECAAYEDALTLLPTEFVTAAARSAAKGRAICPHARQRAELRSASPCPSCRGERARTH